MAGESKLYFAYGSNMDNPDLKEWCKKKQENYSNLNLLGMASLNNFKLVFNHYSKSRGCGAANIMEFSGSIVFGLLFNIGKDDISILDKKEGYPKTYEKLYIEVTACGQKFSNVLTYKLIQSKEQPEHVKPTKQYLDLIINNAKKNDFPDYYIQYLSSIITKDCLCES